ncbi:hypothetical protein ACIOKD_05980 [Streptomyces sp. NPDC087844]|uniref:hypothetical protein n=1 Tax=Streptomyces sp. NPDC087844 TaxID=3365805 RepID=UPI003807CD70
MAKNRITLTLDPGEDAAIREAAAEYGLDLSAFLRTAALAEVARCRRIRDRFAEVDAVSRAAEGNAPEDQPDASPEDDAAMDAYLDAIDGGFGTRGSTVA